MDVAREEDPPAGTLRSLSGTASAEEVKAVAVDGESFWFCFNSSEMDNDCWISSKQDHQIIGPDILRFLSVT